MKYTIAEELVAHDVGLAVLEYLSDRWTPDRLAQEAENRALKVLEDIRRILDDKDLEDPECFRRIEAIVNVLEENGIRTTRHSP